MSRGCDSQSTCIIHTRPHVLAAKGLDTKDKRVSIQPHEHSVSTLNISSMPTGRQETNHTPKETLRHNPLPAPLRSRLPTRSPTQLQSLTRFLRVPTETSLVEAAHCLFYVNRPRHVAPLLRHGGSSSSINNDNDNGGHSTFCSSSTEEETSMTLRDVRPRSRASRARTPVITNTSSTSRGDEKHTATGRLTRGLGLEACGGGNVRVGAAMRVGVKHGSTDRVPPSIGVTGRGGTRGGTRAPHADSEQPGGNGRGAGAAALSREDVTYAETRLCFRPVGQEGKRSSAVRR